MTSSCQNFYDIRAFGLVMTLAYNCGQVKSVQLGFAKKYYITPGYQHNQLLHMQMKEKSSKMGRKSIVPYALYKLIVYFAKFSVKETGGTF